MLPVLLLDRDFLLVREPVGASSLFANFSSAPSHHRASLCFSPPPKDTRPRPSLSNPPGLTTLGPRRAAHRHCRQQPPRPLGQGGQGPPSPGTTNWLPNHVRRLGFSARLRREGLIREKLGEDGPPLRVRRIFQTLGSSNHSHTRSTSVSWRKGYSTRNSKKQPSRNGREVPWLDLYTRWPAHLLCLVCWLARVGGCGPK